MKQGELGETIKRLPELPGIYKYLNSDGEIIYIGKAKNLKKRVSSYFVKQNAHNRKTKMMVSKICDVQITIVDTENDALLLENVLIKKYQPKYNINLKDDKTYPFIAIKNEGFPRIIYTRNPVKDGSEYFGPYASLTVMHTILDLIKELYLTRTCNLNLTPENIKAGKFRSCLEYQLGNCKAPCIGNQTQDEYDKAIRDIRNILKVNISEVMHFLKHEMQNTSANLQFEEAASFKKKLDILTNYQSKSTVVSQSISNLDVFSIVTDNGFAFVNYLKVMNGMIIQTQTVELKTRLDETEDEILRFAIEQLREKYSSNSKEIVVPFSVDFSDDSVIITVPKLGDKKKLLDLSTKNALFYKRDKLLYYEKLNPELKTDRLLTQMMQDLRLKDLPRHIECFDNSNIQGTNPVSACVVFKNGKPSKSDYRHFIPKTVVGPDDFATMREVVYRRYKRMLDENQKLPDLLVIDGGKGQLSSAISSLKELNLYGKIPVLGIAKRLEELYYPEDELPLYLNKKSETLKVIQQLRDEAHRFGITHHRNRRSKNTFQSELIEIPGIGKQTVQLLLKTFKSVKKVKEADYRQLVDLVGEKRADKIQKYFIKH
ncbi:MAG: excinuclease ABC subunit C [Bacteroidia bacterium]|nr:excinuclease ABC subunit C [Bacteroidia bacterium]